MTNSQGRAHDVTCFLDHYRVRALWVQPPTRVYRTLLLRRARLTAAGGHPFDNLMQKSCHQKYRFPDGV